MTIKTEEFDAYMRRTYLLARSEFAPSYDWIFLQLDRRGKKIGEPGIVQAGVFNQIMAMSQTVQEAGNIVIKILRGQIGQQQAVTPQAPAPLPWDMGMANQQVAPMAPQQVPHMPQPQYETPAAPAFYQPDIPQQNPAAPQGYYDPRQQHATQEEIQAMAQGQHIDDQMGRLLGEAGQMQPPVQDSSFDQAMQQAQMPPQQLQGQPAMDFTGHPRQDIPQVPENLTPPPGLQDEVFPIVEDEDPILPNDAPF